MQLMNALGEPPVYQQHSHIQDSGLASNNNNICPQTKEESERGQA